MADAVAKALAKKPEDRYETAARFAEALTADRTLQPTEASRRPADSEQSAGRAHPFHRPGEGAGGMQAPPGGDAAADPDRHRRLREDAPRAPDRGGTARELPRRRLVRRFRAVDRREPRRRDGGDRARRAGSRRTKTFWTSSSSTSAESVSCLILDNCEHLLTASAELADALLRSGEALRILATSREGLGIEGERLFALRSLAVPPQDGRRQTAGRWAPWTPSSCSWTGRRRRSTASR